MVINLDQTTNTVAESSTDNGSLSCIQAAILLLATGIGTGVLVLPRGMAAVGYVPMTALLFFGSVLSAFTTWILFLAVAAFRQAPADDVYKRIEGGNRVRADSLASLGSFTSGTSVDRSGVGIPHVEKIADAGYADLLAAAVSPHMRQVLNAILVVDGVGTIICYLLFIPNFLRGLGWTYSSEPIIIGTACITYFLTLSPTVGGLAKFAPLSLFSLLFLTCCVVLRSPEASAVRPSVLHGEGDVDKLPAVGCLAVFSYCWHTCAVPIARELKDPSWTRSFSVCFMSAGLLFAVYLLISGTGYASWGDALLENPSVVDMYSNTDSLFVCVRVLMISALFVTIPINIYPTRECAMNMIGGDPKSEIQRYSYSACILAVAAVVAIVYPNVVSIITLLGGTLATCLMVIFPALIGRLVFEKGQWLVVLTLLLPVAAATILAALGFIGTEA